MDAALAARVGNHLRTLRVVWLAHLATLVVLGAVTWVVEPPGGSDRAIVWMLAGVAAFELPLVAFLRYRTMGGTLALVAPDDLRPSQGLSAEMLGQALLLAQNRYQVGTFLGLAMSEAVALLGFVATWLTGDRSVYPAFALFAAMLMLVQFPRLAGVRAVLPAEARVTLDRALR